MPSFIAILLRLLPALCVALLAVLPAQAAALPGNRLAAKLKEIKTCHVEEAAGNLTENLKSKTSSKADSCNGNNADCAVKCASQNIKPTPLGLAFGVIPSRPGCQNSLLVESFDSTPLPTPERPPRLI